MVDVYATTCPCPCHVGGPYTPCTIPGGCGHLHTEHRCARADRCIDWIWVDTYDPDTGDTTHTRAGTLINTERGLCPACFRHTETVLHDLPRDYTELTLLLGRGTGASTGEPVAGSRELPVPVRVEVDAVCTAMVTEAVCWAEAVAERLRVTWDSHLVDHHTRPGVALQRATHLLAGALSPLLAIRGWTRMVWSPDGHTSDPADQDGVDGAIALVELHHRARRLAGLTRLVHRMPVPCGSCGRKTLCRDDGGDTVWCGHCGRRYTEDEYTAYTGPLARSTPAAA